MSCFDNNYYFINYYERQPTTSGALLAQKMKDFCFFVFLETLYIMQNFFYIYSK